jgi:hypothetical protein
VASIRRTFGFVPRQGCCPARPVAGLADRVLCPEVQSLKRDSRFFCSAGAISGTGRWVRSVMVLASIGASPPGAGWVRSAPVHHGARLVEVQASSPLPRASVGSCPARRGRAHDLPPIYSLRAGRGEHTILEDARRSSSLRLPAIGLGDQGVDLGPEGLPFGPLGLGQLGQGVVADAGECGVPLPLVVVAELQGDVKESSNRRS